MGLLSRTIRVVRAKLNTLLSRNENPVEQMELAYQDMLDERQQMKSSLIDVKAQRNKLERKVERFQQDVGRHNRQAREAMKQGDEDLARAAVEKKKSKMELIEDLQAQIDDIARAEDDMYEKLDEIEDKIEDLKVEKDVLSAKYEGAQAVESVNEHMAEGLGDKSIDQTMDDVRDEIDEMQSRAEAITELEDEESEDIETQLDQLSSSAAVDNEIEMIREEVGDEAENEPVTV